MKNEVKTSDTVRTKPIPFKTQTPYGRIVAYKAFKEERYYFCIDEHKTVAFMPESALEPYRGSDCKSG